MPALQTRRRIRNSRVQRDRVRGACDPDPVEVDHRDGLCGDDLREGYVGLRLPRVPLQSRVSIIVGALEYHAMYVLDEWYFLSGGAGVTLALKIANINIPDHILQEGHRIASSTSRSLLSYSRVSMAFERVQ